MLCKFVKTNKELICERCGRRSPHSHKFVSAKCRLPDKYITKQKEIYYTVKKEYPGVGTCLLNLLTKINIKYDHLSNISAKAKYLDKQGIEWCENNQTLILEWIKEESKNRNLTYNAKFSKIILRLAIQKSKGYRSLVT